MGVAREPVLGQDELRQQFERRREAEHSRTIRTNMQNNQLFKDRTLNDRVADVNPFLTQEPAGVKLHETREVNHERQDHLFKDIASTDMRNTAQELYNSKGFVRNLSTEHVRKYPDDDKTVAVEPNDQEFASGPTHV